MSIFNASCLGRMGAKPKKSGANHHNRRAYRKGPAQLKKIHHQPAHQSTAPHPQTGCRR